MADLGKLWFGVDLDLSDLKSKIASGNREILEGLKVNVPIDTKYYEDTLSRLRSELGKQTLTQKDINLAIRQGTQEQQRLNASMNEGVGIASKLGAAISGVFAVNGIHNFLDNVIEVGGQLEKQRISMGAIIGDTARANELFEQIKDLAIKSPFGVVELDQYSKQLAAYGIEQSKLFDMTKRLADISAGAGQDIGRLALALGHVKSATYLTGITLRQFSMNNIPMLKMLADYYTEIEHRAVSTAEVQKRISKRQVSYDDVIEQIRRMTDEGGQFYNMQEKISESLQAKFKNLRDSLDIMYGEIAESKVGSLLKELAATLTNLSRHWQEVMSVVGAAGVIWAGYRVSLMAVNNSLMTFGSGVDLTTQKLNAQRIALGVNRAALSVLSPTTIKAMTDQKLLSREQLLGAVASKRLTVAQAELAATTFNVSKAELTRIASMGRLGLMMRSVTAGIRSLGIALKGLMFNPFTIILTVVSAAVELFMHFQNKAEEAKETVKALTDTAAEGYRNVREVLDKFPKEVNDKDTLAGGIKELTEALKNYAPNADNILADAQALATLEEKYSYLREELESTKRAYADLEETADYVVNADASTGNLINDTFSENVEDYIESLQDLRKAEQDFLIHREAIGKVLRNIANYYPEFAKARYDEDGNLKSIKEQIEILKGIDLPNLGSGFHVFASGLRSISGSASKDFNEWIMALSDSHLRFEKELMPDLEKFADRLDKLYTETKGWGVNWKENGDHVKTALLEIEEYIGRIPDMTDDVKKDLLDKIFNERWHLNIDFSVEEATETLSGWQKEMQEYFDANNIYIRLSMSSTREDVIKQVEEERKKAQTAVDNAGPVLIGLGFKLDKLPAWAPTQWGQDALDTYKEQTDYVNKLNAAIERYNLNVNDKGAAAARKKEETAAARAAKEREKRAAKALEQQWKQEEELRKMEADAARAREDASISSICDQADRERAEREAQHKRAIEDLKRQEEEIYKEIYKRRKEAYENENKDKKYANDELGRLGWQGVVGSAKTEDEQKYINERLEIIKAGIEKEIAIYARYHNDREKLEKESRQAVLEAMAEGTAKEIAQLNYETQEKLKALKDEYRSMVAAREQTAKDMAEMNGEVFDPTLLDFSDIDAWYKFKLKGLAATFEKGMLDIDENNQEALDKMLSQYGEYEDKKAAIEREGERKMEKLRKQYTAAQTKEEKKRLSQLLMLTDEETKKKLEALNDEETKKTKEKVDKITSALQETLSTVNELGSAMKDMFDIDEEDYKKFSKGLQSVQSLAEGIGKIKTGDYLGGALGILSGLVNAVSLLSGDDESYRQQVLERIDRNLEVSNKNIEKLTETLEKSYGLTAWKLGEQAAAELTKSVSDVLRALSQMDDLPQRLKEALGAVGGGGRDYDSNGLPGHGSGWSTGNKRNGEGALDYEWIQNNKQAIIEAINALNNPAYTLSEDTKKYLEELEKLLEQIDELEKSINEQLTGTTVDNVYEDFLNSLYDFADGSEDVMNDIAENWQKMVNRMVVNNIVGESFRKQLTETEGDQKSWYDRLAELQHQFSEGIIDNTAYREAMQALIEEYNGYVAAAQGQIQVLTEQGIIKSIETVEEEQKKYFENLLDSWKSTLTDLSKSTEDWKNELIDQVFSDLVESTILNVPIDVDTTEGQKHFDDFSKYLENWTERYKKVIEGSYENEADRIAAINALIQEQTEVREQLAENSKEIAAGLGKTITEEFSNSIDSLGDTLLDALLDTEKDAEQVGKEIAQTLIKEMLSEMLKSSLYADRIAAIKQMWQDILTGKDTVHTLDDVLAEITQLNNDIANDESISALAERYQELGKAAEEAAEEAESAFKDLRSTFIDALTDMDSSLDSFRKKLEETAIRDLMEKTVLDAPFSAGLNGLVKDFTGIDDYIAQWTELYEAAAKAGETELIDALLDELAAVFELTEEKAKELRERLKQVTRDTTFTNMEDSFVSALMDMDGDIMDFAKDMKKTIVQNLVEAFMVSDKIRPMLQELQKTFDFVMGQKGWTNEQRIDFMAQGGTIDGEEYKGLDEYNDDMKAMYETAQGLLAYFGIVKTETDELLGSITNNITSMLTDGESTAKDFAASLKESIVNSLIDAYTASEDFQQGLAEVKKQMEEAIKSGDPEKIQTAEEAAKKFWDETTEGVKQYTDALEKAQQEQDSTFKDMTSELMSSLTDIDKIAEDWAKELGRKIAEKIFEGMIKESALLEDIQKAFNDAVAAATTTDEGGISHIDWKKVANNAELKQQIEASKDDFDGLRANWEYVCSVLGIELEHAAKEGFSDLRGTIVSSLMDVEGDLESFRKNLSKTMLEQMLDSYINSRWKDQIAAYNKEWAEALESGSVSALEDIKQKVVTLYDAIGNTPEVQDLANAIKDMERELDTTFSDMADSWASALMDMEKTAEEWAQDVGKIIAEKIVKELIVPTMVQPLMDEMQSAMTSLFDIEGATWGDVVKTGQEYLGLISETFEEVHPLVEAILNSFGIFREETEATEEEVEYALGDLRSEFVNALMNMESDAEAFSQSIGKIMSEAFIDKYILGEAFDAQMEAWQQEFERINTSGLSEDERKRQLKQLQDAIASAKDGYASQAMAIQELLGLNASAAEDQKAAANIADKITYEQADELVGINMAQEMTLEQILATLRGGVSTAGYATGTVTEGSGAVALELLAAIRMMQNGVSIGTNSDIFNRLGYTNEYLRTIRDNSRSQLEDISNTLHQMNGRLARL